MINKQFHRHQRKTSGFVLLLICLAALAPACSPTGSALQETPTPADGTSPASAPSTVTASPTTSASPAATPVPLDVNDISFLWPVPKTKADVDALISLNDQIADSKIFPDELLEKLIIEAKTVSVGTAHIRFPDEAQFKKPITWKVAGIRVNPSALGTRPEVLKQIGIVPGLRFIVQPVTMDGDKVHIHDFAAHVVFNFIQNQAPPFLPDNEAFDSLIAGLGDIKAFLQQSGVSTANQELNIHPAFAKNVPGFTDKLRSLLKAHLKRQRLAVVSFMGVPSQFEPWIFFKVTVLPDGTLKREQVSGRFNSSDQPTSQMLSFNTGAKVEPAPVLDAAAPTKAFGISTSPLFSNDVGSHLDDKLFPAGAPGPIAPLKIRDVADMIANPAFHNTATTDCVSCHTETTRRKIVPGLTSQPGIAFRQPADISKVAAAVLPGDKWNLRNFGWGFNFGARTFAPTITQRAANEAAESAEVINKSAAAPAATAQPIAIRDKAIQMPMPY